MCLFFESFSGYFGGLVVFVFATKGVKQHGKEKSKRRGQYPQAQ